jgi:acyl-homoserine-lactone acylase
VTHRDRSTRPFRRAISLAAAGALALTVAPFGAAAQENAPPPRSTDRACPGEPTSDFTDIAGSPHEDNIRCLADLGITAGLRGGTTYGPRLPVERGQMATMIHRLLRLTLGEAPPAGPDAFRDDDGSVHEPAIDSLAALGIVQGRRDGTFDVFGHVTRGQMAAFVARALDHADDGQLNGSFPPAGPDAFRDDDGSVHEDAIDAIAALGIVRGFPDGTYRPGAAVTRDQVATFLVRAYDVALEAGFGDDDDGDPIEDAEFAATIRRTALGVPHIEAEDVGSLAYGMGYSSGQDTICLLMDRIMTANGERARYLGAGPGSSNVTSDLYHARLEGVGTYDGLDDEPGAHPGSPSADARAMARGFVTGVNRYLDEVGGADGISDPTCAGQPWVREITEDEYWRVLTTFIGAQNAAAMVAATPPGQPAQDAAVDAAPHAELEDAMDPETEGSNAYAFGSETTENGRGALLGNPHYPWMGPLRFYRAHLTIPGELNVVGAGIVNTPFIGIGHTDRIAWTHTVSTAQRFGFFQLALDPEDPTRYVVDGQSVPMDRNEVSVEVLEDGELSTREHTFYETRYGTVVSSPQQGLTWTDQAAYTFRVTFENLRLADQYLAMSQAEDVQELFEALGAHQATAYNTTATDADGGTLFTDAGAIPHITEAHWSECVAGPIGQLFRQQRTPLLDGSRSTCAWRSDEDAVVPGIFGPGSVPTLFRDDHVSNMNDSHWLTHPEQPLEGYPRMFGDERTQRSLRTRLGIVQIQERLAGEDGLEGDKVGLEHLQEMLYGNRVYSGELVRDDLVAACREADEEGLEEACDVLEAWDLRVDTDSRGAHLFLRFVNRGGLVWSVPFDVNDPVHTPNTLNTDSPAVLNALRQAVADVRDAGVALDAPWGEIQTELRPVCSTPWDAASPETRGDACVEGEEERIPIHGGPGGAGIFNVITGSNGLPSSRVTHGASWVMSVVFTDDGPVSEGLLTYSQSPDPTSPFHSDQTRLYAQEGWDPLLFDPADVREAARSTVVISTDD